MLSTTRPARACLTGLLLLASVLLVASRSSAEESGKHETGPGSVQISADEQQRSGIEFTTPTLSQLTPESTAYGRVVDIDPLLKLYSACQEAAAELAAAQASLDASDKSLHRLRQLHDEAGNVSARQLQEAQAAYQQAVSRVTSAKVRVRAARDQLAQNWGGPVADALLDGHSLDISDYVHQRRMLVLVTLPTEAALPDGTRNITINRSDDRSDAWQAQLVAPAPFTSGSFQGETWFFSTSPEHLRVGMRIYAWIPRPGKIRRGVMLPGSAIVWAEGKPCIFIRQSGGGYERRELNDPVDLNDHWFIPDPSLAGLDIVTTGAQMLLSEEYQRTIPDEDDQP